MGLNCKGIASTADAVIFLAMMLLAISVMFLSVGQDDDTASEQSWETTQARWLAQSLCKVTTDDGTLFSVGLALGDPIDADWLERTLELMIPEGSGCNISWSINGQTGYYGEGPLGNSGGWTVKVGDGILTVRIFSL